MEWGSAEYRRRPTTRWVVTTSICKGSEVTQQREREASEQLERDQNTWLSGITADGLITLKTTFTRADEVVWRMGTVASISEVSTTPGN